MIINLEKLFGDRFMLIKPPLFLVFVFLCGLVLSIYNIYRILVHPQKARKGFLTWESKLPKWYPLRKQGSKRSNKNSSLSELIFLIFLSLIMLSAIGFLFIAWFIGQ